MSDGQGSTGAADTGATGGEQQQAGSAADLIGGDTGGGSAKGEKSGGEQQQGTGDSGQGGDGGQTDAAYQDWLAGFSADPGENESPSMRDWVQSTGAKDLNALAKIARDNQRALRESGRVKVPGEGASEQEVAEYRKALGVPDDAKGYEAPKLVDSEGKQLTGSDGEPLEIDQERFGAIAAYAHEAGMPKAAFEAVMQKVAELDLQAAAAAENAIQERAAAHAKKWGDQAAEKTAAINRAAEALGLTRTELLSIRAAITPERALDIFAKLGEGISEDTMVRGSGRQSFGISGAEAQKQLDARMADKSWRDKAMVPGSQENAEYQRLNNAIGADADRKARENA